jgi:hypothetical protein
MAWTQNRNDIAKRVLNICGVISVNQTPTTAQYSQVGTVIQSVIEDLHNDGYRGSQIEKTSMDLTDGDNCYDTASGTLEVIMAYINDGSSDLPPLIQLNESQYYGLIEEKADEGVPTHCYVENKEDPDVYLWPTPDSSTYDLHYIRIKKSASVDTSASTVDLEKRWIEAITYRTAEDMCDELKVKEEKALRIASKAKSLVKKAKSLDFYRQDGNNGSEGAYPNA